MPEQVTVGQVAQQAIERLQSRFDALQAALGEVRTQSAQLQDAFRQLLSYCETAAARAERNDRMDIADAYDDITRKLRDLLDGE